MNIPKAIEVLDDNIKAQPPGANCDYFDAVKLGIEALKRCKDSKQYSHFHTYKLLPGETED